MNGKSNVKVLYLSMRIIPLTNGYSTKVDDEDYVKFASMSLHAFTSKGQVRARTGICKKGITRYLSRLIMNAPKSLNVDHINGDTLDNRKSNLRFCDQSQNMANVGKPTSNTSGYKGVNWDKVNKKWRAVITVKNREVWLGRFKIKLDAVRAYNTAAKLYFGDFAQINKT